MFNKILSSVGIGAAKVDTRVHSGPVQPGGLIEGEVVIKGGKVDQEINQIRMVLVTTFIEEGDEHVHTHHYELNGLIVADRFTIRAGEDRTIPFELEVPWETPITTGHQHVYLATSLDVSGGVDPKDHDPIEVVPDPIVHELLAQAEQLGFRHTHDSGRCQYHPSGDVPYIQEFELKPTGAFKRDLEELELFFEAYPEGVEVFAQVDMRARGLSGYFREAAGLDEHFVRFPIERGQDIAPDELECFLRHVLESR